GPVRRRTDGVLQARESRLGPAVIGVIKPAIVLPSDFYERFDTAERKLIIAHEAQHVRAGHVHLNGAMVLIQALSWFNPLVYVAAYFIRIDQEMACDEGVMGKHPDYRRTYAEAMVKTQLAHAAPVLGCAWPNRSLHPLAERVAMLRKDTPNRLHRAAGVLA